MSSTMGGNGGGIFCPPNSYKMGRYTTLRMHNYAVNRKFKCLQYQSAIFGYRQRDAPSIEEIFAMSDDQLFSKINSNSLHILQQFMPDRPSLNTPSERDLIIRL